VNLSPRSVTGEIREERRLASIKAAPALFRKGMFPEQLERSVGGIDKSAFFTAPFRWFSEYPLTALDR
jgi:hypothetical protein